MMRPEALPDFVLVVNSETFTHTIDYNDRRQAVLFGDAASAAIVSSRVPSPCGDLRYQLRQRPGGQHQVTIPTGGHFAQDGHAVQVFAIKTTTDVVKKLQSLRARARRAAARYSSAIRPICACWRTSASAPVLRWKITTPTSPTSATAGAAGAPTVLSQHWDELRDCVILMAVVGSGLAWGGMRISRE